MKRFVKTSWQIAIQWSVNELQYLLARRSGRQVNIVAADSVSLDDGSSQDQLAEHVQHILTQHGVRRADAFAVLGRPHVELIPLDLPPATEEELPDIVAMQAAQKLAEGTAESVIDFVIRHGDAPDCRRVLACVLRNQTLSFLSAVARQTRLKLVRIGVRPLCSLPLADDALPSPLVTVTRHTNEADLTLLLEGQLLLTRTVRLPVDKGDAHAQAISQEIQRSLLLAAIDEQETTCRVIVHGSNSASHQLCEQLNQQLPHFATAMAPCPAKLRDGNLTGSGAFVKDGRFAPLFGVLLSDQSAMPQIDFLSPRRAPVTASPYRRYSTYAVAAATLLLLGVWMVRQDRATQNSDIEVAQRQLSQLTKHVEKLQRKQNVVTAVQQWQQNDITWLDELRDFVDRFPQGDQAFLRRMSISTDDRVLGVINLEIRVADPSQLEAFEQRIRDDSHAIESKRVAEQERNDGFPWQFESAVRLRRRDRDAYAAQFAQQTPDAPNTPETPNAENRADVRVVQPEATAKQFDHE